MKMTLELPLHFDTYPFSLSAGTSLSSEAPTAKIHA